MKLKTTFILDTHKADLTGSELNIIGMSPTSKPYVSISLPYGKGSLFVEDKDLEKLAVNILKALKSKHLKPNQQ